MQNPTHDDTIPVDFARAAIELLISHSRDPRELLRVAGISSMLLEDQRSRITIEQASTLVRTVWRETGDELFGLGYRAIPKQSAPTLILQGRSDNLVNPKLTRANLTRYPVQVTYAEFDGGHDLYDPSKPAWDAVQEQIKLFAGQMQK